MNFLEAIMLRSCLAAFFLLLNTVAAQAQESWWVQIAARPTLAEATEFARAAASRLSGINGFYLGNGFYAIAIGPFDRPEAERVRLRLLSTAAIPGDSYVTSGGTFDRQFWPVGGGIATPAPAPAPAPIAPSALPDETPREARASESLLTRTEREELQRALAWAGFYDAAIDGAFGRGTRAAMENWQIANAMEPTGVLTTRQRAELFRQYNAVLDALDIRTIRDQEAGISLRIPAAAVSFSEYQPPFAKYEGTGAARVILISQEGDSDLMRGLYEIMQSLDIVPLEGPRRIRADSFVIEGVDDKIISHTEVRLVDGAIKGFTLVWPADDRAAFDRLLPEMQRSFEVFGGALDPEIVPVSAAQSIDMVAGLAIRQPKLVRSGFYISAQAHVVTTETAVAQCDRITVDGETEMTVLAGNADLGLAVLAPVTAETPADYARFDTSTPRLRDRIAVAGFPYGGVLVDPTLTFGTIADLRNLNGDTRQLRLELAAQPSDSGGALLNRSGLVTGMLLEQPASTTQLLPEGVSFAVKASEITLFLETSGVPFGIVDEAPVQTPVALTRQVADLGVLVSCW